jgi:hypothetical protein
MEPTSIKDNDLMDDLPLVPDLKWLERDQNPYTVRCLDVRSFTTTMISTAVDQKQAQKFKELRTSMGKHLGGKLPDDMSHVDCQLVYPHQGATRDGPLFLAKEMEDKWDVFLFDGALFFTRSWSGVLVYRAEITFMDTQAIISSIDSLPIGVQGGAWLAICAVDFLVKSLLYRREAPHTIPPSVPDDDMGIAAYSFREYGRWASYATFEDTTRINVNRCPLRG